MPGRKTRRCAVYDPFTETGWWWDELTQPLSERFLSTYSHHPRARCPSLASVVSTFSIVLRQAHLFSFLLSFHSLVFPSVSLALSSRVFAFFLTLYLPLYPSPPRHLLFSFTSNIPPSSYPCFPPFRHRQFAPRIPFHSLTPFEQLHF